MSPLILFRYHRAFDVCGQTLRLLRALNPGVPIYGLFGGQDDGGIPGDILAALDGNWTIPTDDYFYKWRNGDICVRDWYRQVGRHIDFDHLYLIEWDMLMTGSLQAIYGALEKNTNAMTLFGTHASARQSRWWWVDGYYGMELSWLIGELADRGASEIDIDSLPLGHIGGSVLCRNFLDRFAAEAVPSYSNDEVRLSIYSALYGIPVRDNGILSRSLDNGNFFRAEDYDLRDQELNDFFNRRGLVLHPLRRVVPDIDKTILAMRETPAPPFFPSLIPSLESTTPPI